MAIFGSNGQPADGSGSDGDFAFDYKNRIFFGPKGNVTAGSWSGTANSVQGPAGLGVISGSGAPSSAIGQVGNSYVDVATGNLYAKTSSGWAQGGALVSQFSPVLQGNGPPNSSTAPIVQTGQLYFDNSSALLYGPSTSASYTGLTAVNNLVGPTGATGATGPTTSYRHVVRGEWWRPTAITANTAYPVNNVLSAASLGSNYQGYDIVLSEPMYASGSLTAVTAFAVSSVAGVLSLNILKNGSVLYTAGSLMTITATPGTTAQKTVPSGYTFAAGDVITMSASSTTGTANQHAFFNLFYTTNS